MCNLKYGLPFEDLFSQMPNTSDHLAWSRPLIAKTIVTVTQSTHLEAVILYYIIFFLILIFYYNILKYFYFNYFYIKKAV